MRHVRKQQKSLMPKILLIVVLVAALSISSVVTVMANTADITVYDGSETYRFSMIGQNPQDILSRAQTEGMAPVSDIDTYDFSPENGTLTVQRFVRVSVKEDNASQMILAPKGKTLSDVFAETRLRSAQEIRQMPISPPRLRQTSPCRSPVQSVCLFRQTASAVWKTSTRAP